MSSPRYDPHHVLGEYMQETGLLDGLVELTRSTGRKAGDPGAYSALAAEDGRVLNDLHVLLLGPVSHALLWKRFNAGGVHRRERLFITLVSISIKHNLKTPLYNDVFLTEVRSQAGADRQPGLVDHGRRGVSSHDQSELEDA